MCIVENAYERSKTLLLDKQNKNKDIFCFTFPYLVNTVAWEKHVPQYIANCIEFCRPIQMPYKRCDRPSVLKYMFDKIDAYFFGLSSTA